MAVFTEVSPLEVQPLLDQLNLGTLQAMNGCASGIENTNYFVTTTQGDYVLTLFERLTAEQLPFYLNLMQHLAHKGIPVPAPQADQKGRILHALKDKPAALVTKLSGRNQMSPNVAHCQQVGAMLAHMHLAAQDYPDTQANLRGLEWWKETVPVVVPHLFGEAKTMIERELAHQQQLATTAVWQSLPSGPIHADLFRDNVMFDGAQLQGFFDFYFAGCDAYVFDIAVCLNDWCIDWQTGVLDTERAQAFVQAYDAQRTLCAEEIIALPDALRGAALRFWTSRLWDFYLPRDAAMLKPHDPAHFERILALRQHQPWHYVRPMNNSQTIQS
jgi:homoserine kinase type II